ncbi:MAG TPA: aminopeptidase [Nevskiales bacterium]|nr:aminopeptidase [Nevskiales bacterium]
MRALLLLFLALLGGCAQLAYYNQALQGQSDLLARRRHLDLVLAETGDGELRARLDKARDMRDYASRALALPANGSYTGYADLGRPWVVLNVFATPELSLQPRRWCFPIVGCLDYRGYFRRDYAERLAAELRAQGYDVWLGPVPAYSSLGWFDDPLLNTFIRWDDGRLAELLFHELAHQRYYLAGDTEFNEAYASAVGRLGARRWLAERGTAEERQRYELFLQRQRQFLTLVLQARERLQALYASALPEAEKRAGKARVLEQLRARYRGLRDTEWGGFAGYDPWFERDLNNAKLAAVVTYERYVPAFEALFRAQGEDFRRFHQAVEALGALLSRAAPPGDSGRNDGVRPGRADAAP